MVDLVVAEQIPFVGHALTCAGTRRERIPAAETDGWLTGLYYTPAQEERTRPDTKTPPRTLASAKKNQKKKQELKDNQSAQMPRQ